jgi:hypothetical protein
LAVRHAAATSKLWQENATQRSRLDHTVRPSSPGRDFERADLLAGREVGRSVENA